MGEFQPSVYEIVRDGTIVFREMFSSCPEILGYIARRLPPGVYIVYRLAPPGSRDRPYKSVWAGVTNHGGECVTYRLDPTRI